MQNLNFLETELLDILFRGKNKNYGAYALRKNYATHAKQALGFTILLLLLLSGVHHFIPKPEIVLGKLPSDYKEGHIKQLSRVEIIRTNPPMAAPPQTNTTKNNIPTEIVKHDLIKPIEKKDKLIDISVPQAHETGVEGTKQPVIAGSGDVGTSTTTVSSEGSNKNTSIQTTTAESSAMTAIGVAEVMPEFPGGEAALLAYLKTHMNYPKLASEMGIEGIVYVQFVVNTKGNISDIELLRGIGGGCDGEAQRVIKSMPLWKPGMQDGHKVNVSFVLPIEFEL